jgi:hypothetical protein
MHFDLFDNEQYGPSQDYGISRSRDRRRKQQPGKIRTFISYGLMALGWTTQDFRKLVRA